MYSFFLCTVCITLTWEWVIYLAWQQVRIISGLCLMISRTTRTSLGSDQDRLWWSCHYNALMCVLCFRTPVRRIYCDITVNACFSISDQQKKIVMLPMCTRPKFWSIPWVKHRSGFFFFQVYVTVSPEIEFSNIFFLKFLNGDHINSGGMQSNTHIQVMQVRII